ncbi:MAG: hypothetical protein ACKVJX_07620 [Verrucomicrobiia bacterium]|jgi:hypothetical protein
MEILTRQNIVVLALIQLGALFAAIAGAALAGKLIQQLKAGEPIPWLSEWLPEWGLLFTLFPVVWSGAAGYVLHREDSETMQKFACAASGWLILAGFIALNVVGAILPALGALT